MRANIVHLIIDWRNYICHWYEYSIPYAIGVDFPRQLIEYQSLACLVSYVSTNATDSPTKYPLLSIYQVHIYSNFPFILSIEWNNILYDFIRTLTIRTHKVLGGVLTLNISNIHKVHIFHIRIYLGITWYL